MGTRVLLVDDYVALRPGSASGLSAALDQLTDKVFVVGMMLATG